MLLATCAPVILYLGRTLRKSAFTHLGFAVMAAAVGGDRRIVRGFRGIIRIVSR